MASRGSKPTPPARQRALVLGVVQFREGDGPMLQVPVGEVEVVMTSTDVTFAWQDGDSRGSATMPLTDFRHHVNAGRVRLSEAPLPADSSPKTYR
jgi:hypothetical protein